MTRRKYVALGSLAFVTALLGSWGFSRFDNGTTRSAANALYQATQLFFYGFWHAPSGTQVPWQLEIARWLAPLISATAFVSILGFLFSRVLRGADRSSAKAFSDHVVLIGLGSTGRAIAFGLVAATEAVVVIERDETNEAVSIARSLGIPVIIGDGLDVRTLAAAGVDRAARVLVVTGPPAASLRAAEGVCGYSAKARPASAAALLVAVHVGDLRLAPSIEAACTRPEGRTRVVCVCAEFSGLAMLLNEYPLPTAGDSLVTVVGAGTLAATFLLQAAARQMVDFRGEQPLTVRLVAPTAFDFVKDLLARYRGIETVLKLEAHEVMGVSGELLDWSGALAGCCGKASARTYLLQDSDESAVATAFLTAGFFSKRGEQAVVPIRDAVAFVELMPPSIKLHPLLATLLDPEVAFAGTSELLARAIHDAYKAMRARTGFGGPVGAKDWQALPDGQKEANRAAARDIPRKLAAVGFEAIPVNEWSASVEVFSAAEREALAEVEHERWCAFTSALGYQWGPDRSETPGALRHPDLVAWGQLSPEARQKDSEQVAQIPRLLAMIGYRLRRTSGALLG